MTELLVADDYLKVCQSWQEVINAQPTIEAKNEAGGEALRSLGSLASDNTGGVIVHGETALLIPDGTSPLEEQLWPGMQFGELKARGWLGELKYLRLKNEAFIAWPLYEPSVISSHSGVTEIPKDEDLRAGEILHTLPIDRHTRRPLHFPVGLINYAIGWKR